MSESPEQWRLRFSSAQHDPRAASEEMLVAGAKRWMREALEAWVEGEHPKVGLMAPMALEFRLDAYSNDCHQVC